MNIPGKVRISGINYDVLQTTRPIIVNGRQCCGSIEYEEHQISIDLSFGDHAGHCSTLLHEIIHGIVRDRQIDFGKDADEEAIVEALARGLYQVLSDNPDLFGVYHT